MNHHLHLKKDGSVECLPGINFSDGREWLGRHDIPEGYENYVTWHGSQKRPVINYDAKERDDRTALLAAEAATLQAEEDAKQTLDYWRDKHLLTIKDLIKAKVASPVLYNGKYYDSNKCALLDIQSFIDSSDLNDADEIKWRCKDNSKSTITIAQLKELKKLVAKNRVEIRQNGHEIKDEIRGGNLADLTAYNVVASYQELEE